MKLSEIINANHWLSIKIILLDLYPDQLNIIDTYESIYKKLQQEQPVDSEIEIVLTECFDDDDIEKNYVDVSGRKKVNEYSDITEGLAIEFVPWNEWLGMNISQDTLRNFTEFEIISHCLYEMTFIDFEETEIQKQMSDLKNTKDEYENMSDEEKKNSTISWEDLLKKLEENDERLVNKDQILL